MTTAPRELFQYLRRRGISGPWTISNAPSQPVSTAVVIPSLAEGASLEATLKSLARNPAAELDQTMVLVVLNHAEDADATVRRTNLEDLANLPHLARETGLSLAWVDAASPGRELTGRHAGVGLARKLGMDLALAQLDWAKPPVLISLDADTLVEPNYLGQVRRHFADQAGAVTLPFQHQAAADPTHQEAIDRYELFLRCHLLGLGLAGSPYAFATIGSAFACRADSYLRSGGMNRRRGGEDFYFLQQMAKTDGVVALAGTRVWPSARVSKRVPFGTGPSVAEQLAGGMQKVRCYPKSCYQVLSDWLKMVAAQPAAPAEVLWQKAAFSATLQVFLEEIGWAQVWERLQRNHEAGQRLAAFHRWFDGLKSLQLIHRLCDREFPRLDVERAAPELFAWGGQTCPGSLCAMLLQLRDWQEGEQWIKNTDYREKLC